MKKQSFFSSDFNHKLIQYFEVEELLLSCFLNIYVNNLRRRSTDKEAKYQIDTENGSFIVRSYSQSKKLTLLGYDKNKKLWFSDIKDPIKLKKNLNSIVPIDLSHLPPQARLSLEIQKDILSFFGKLFLLPPDLASQQYDPQEFALSKRKNPSNNQKCCPSLDENDQATFFANVLQGNHGICFTASHNDKDSFIFLEKMMQEFRKQNVAIFYVELPATLNPLFEQYNSDGKLDQLKTALVQLGFKFNEAYYALFLSAFDAKIKVICVDALGRIKDDQIVAPNEKELTFNCRDDVMVRNIENYNLALAENEHYVVFLGPYHSAVANKTNLNIPVFMLHQVYEKPSQLTLHQAVNEVNISLLTKELESIKLDEQKYESLIENQQGGFYDYELKIDQPLENLKSVEEILNCVSLHQPDENEARTIFDFIAK